jgi:hypothetical protein
VRHLVIAVAISGCAFEPGVSDDDDAPVEDPTDPADPGPLPAPDNAMTPCTVTGAKLCVEFDHAAQWTRDASGLVVTAANVTRQASDLGYAVLLETMSEILVAEAPALDIRDDITFEMWIFGDASIYGNRAHLLDNTNQYAMSITDSMKLRCGVENFSIDATQPLEAGWHHVACTYDKSRLRVYVDGELRGCRSESKAIPTSGNAGTAIGAKLGSTLSEQFTGQIDNVHIYDRRLSGSELCALAGGDDCNDQCPSSGPGGGDD